ncbi:MAG: hypothetical protein AVDCRST_MAG36-1844, partial [uncultured Nocardioidaceae bacterium]
ERRDTWTALRGRAAQPRRDRRPCGDPRAVRRRRRAAPAGGRHPDLDQGRRRLLERLPHAVRRDQHRVHPPRRDRRARRAGVGVEGAARGRARHHLPRRLAADPRRFRPGDPLRDVLRHRGLPRARRPHRVEQL